MAAAVDQVRDPDEARHELGGRPLVDLDGCSDLLDLSPVHDGQPVAHGERLLLVVGHVEERDPDLLLDPFQLGLHLLAQLQVERPERLVEQEELRLVHDRPCQRHALALAPGQLERLAPAETGEPDHLEHALGPLSPLRLGYFADLEAVLHVLGHAQVGEERVVLEDGVHVACVGRLPCHVHPAELDSAAVRTLEARDDPQQGRLARAGGTEHREELTFGDLEVDAVGGQHVPVALAQRREAHGGARATGARRPPHLSRHLAHRAPTAMRA